MSERSRALTWVKAGSFFALFLTLAQASTYLVSLVSAAKLTIDGFGLFSSLLAVLSVLTTVGIGLQITVASAGGSPEYKDKEKDLRDYIFSVVKFQIVSVLVAAPLVAYFLRAPLLLALVFLASSIPMISASGLFGISLAFRSVIVQSVCVFAPVFVRSIMLILGLVYFNDSLLIIGICGVIGSLIGVALVNVVLMRNKSASIKKGNKLNLLPIHIKATASVFALYSLLSTDMLTARWLLDETIAGYYAAGNLVTKVGFFLPSAIGLMASPMLAGRREARIRTVVYSLTVLTGFIYTLIIAVFGRKTLLFLNDQFSLSTSALVLFALLGVAISIIQITVYENALAENYLHPIIMMVSAALIPVGALFFSIADVIDLIWISISVTLTCTLLLILSQQKKMQSRSRSV